MTFYSIHVRMDDRPYHISYEENTFPEIYEDFDDACDALEEEIRKDDPNFVPFNRENFYNIVNKSVVYHKIGDKFFGLLERKLVVKKCQYQYRYHVENSHKNYNGYVDLNGERHYDFPTRSKPYTSFDEVCHVLNKELRELHEAIGKPGWEPRMTREEYRKYIDDNIAISYDFFNDGGGTDIYVLVKEKISP